jgi:hypothetical protein
MAERPEAATETEYAMTPHQDRREILDADAMAEWLGVPRAWVVAHSNGNRKPQIPNIKVGRKLLYKRAEVERFIEHHSRGKVA